MYLPLDSTLPPLMLMLTLSLVCPAITATLPKVGLLLGLEVGVGESVGGGSLDLQNDPRAAIRASIFSKEHLW